MGLACQRVSSSFGLVSEPGDVEDDEEGEGGDAASLWVKTTGIHESSGQVDQAGNDSPSCVDAKSIVDHTIGNTPPEEGSPLSKLCRIFGDVSRHQSHHRNIGESN